jgi:histone acetyltransferase (RNA polymerase elongator complex component)
MRLVQWKIYPTEVTPWTVIKTWFEQGSYVPYDQDTLLEVLIYAKTRVHPWIRLNRVIRDIPMQYVFGALEESNLREIAHKVMRERGLECACIRCREVKDNQAARERGVELVVREYEASGGTEYFISYETRDRKTIFGFVRLRLARNAGLNVAGMPVLLHSKGGKFRQTGYSKDFKSSFESAYDSTKSTSKQTYAEDADGNHTEVIFPAIQGAALVRELHVYGQMVATQDKRTAHSQHTGLGTKLMREAENIARRNGYTRIGVIAGVGVRGFYRRLGYTTDPDSELLVKPITPKWLHACQGLVGWHSVSHRHRTYVLAMLGILLACIWLRWTA